MKLHWPTPPSGHPVASPRPTHRTTLKPLHAGLALLATGSLIFGGNLPAALAQAPQEDATQTDQAEAPLAHLALQRSHQRGRTSGNSPKRRPRSSASAEV